MSPKSTRIAPVNLADLPDEQLAAFGGRNNPFCQLNLFKVLVKHLNLLKSYTPFAMQIGRQTILPARDKEIIILRTATLCKENYETSHHLYIAREAGLSDDEIEAAKHGGEALSPFDRVLIRAVEELVKDHCISNETWAALSKRYTPEQLIEAVFMVGNYTLMAMVTNSLNILPEEDVENSWKPTRKD